MNASDITIVIPTFERGVILVETVERLLKQFPPAAEIIVADQTSKHAAPLQQRLEHWAADRAIRWLRFAEPSIPRSMNEALIAARRPIVLFLDDDIEPGEGLVASHASAHDDPTIWAVAGQILQPGENAEHHSDLEQRRRFRFNHDERCFVTNVMAGNLSVNRERALAVGAFDENFIGAAYCFESDFAVRLVAAGGRIRFEPRASVRHLKLSSGGLRAFGDHRTTANPVHATGDYYFALMNGFSLWRHMARRLRQNVVTRYHARHPWTIPSKLLGEIRGIMLARRLAKNGRRLRTAERAGNA